MGLEGFSLRGRGLRLARIALIAAGGAVLVHLLGAVPQESHLELVLGPEHGQVIEIRVAFLQDGDALQGVRLSFPSGAPPSVPLRADLPRGDVELAVQLRALDGSTREVSRNVAVPVEGRLRVHVEE